MSIEILMPALSPTMTEGKLSKWTVKEGDTVKSGQVIAEIETDKATMEVEAVDEGRIGKILIAEGSEGVAVNTPIAILLEEGEMEVRSGTSDKKTETPIATNNAPSPAVQSAPVQSPISNLQLSSGARVFASPLAKRIAAEKGVTLATIKGTGPHGRIVVADVESAPKGQADRAVASAKVNAPTMSGPNARQLADMLGMDYVAEPNSQIRKIIAKRLTESKQNVPHFYLTVDCEIDKLLDIRAQYNAAQTIAKISVNDMVIKAVAAALIKIPAANAAWTEDAILKFKHADVSVAVATPNGLVTPIIKKAEGKSLTDISKEMKDLGLRARENKLKPEEFQGGTFTISNLGMFGIKQFAAIINPPQGCILAVGAGEKRAIVKNDKLEIATVMTVTLSVDHRVVDGAVGAEFIAAFKDFIENPIGLLL